jgi:hypothetical protein
MEVPQGKLSKIAKMSFSFSLFLIQNQRIGGWNRSCLGELVLVSGRGKKIVKRGECGANSGYTCMEMEK